MRLGVAGEESSGAALGHRPVDSKHQGIEDYLPAFGYPCSVTLTPDSTFTPKMSPARIDHGDDRIGLREEAAAAC